MAFPGGERFRRLSGAALAALLAVAIVVVVAGAGARNVPVTTAFGSVGASESPARPSTRPSRSRRGGRNARPCSPTRRAGRRRAPARAMPDWHREGAGAPGPDGGRGGRSSGRAPDPRGQGRRRGPRLQLPVGTRPRGLRLLVGAVRPQRPPDGSHPARGRRAQDRLGQPARCAQIPAIAPEDLEQFDSFAWYFPWVNQRLQALDRERTDVALAYWTRLGDRRAITYDAIHLDPDGAALYARMVRHAILTERYRAQA